jgi:hypothetical protein
MENWIKCTTTDGIEVRVNLGHVAFIRPHKRDRGGTASEIVFSNGAPSSLVVQEDQDRLRNVK